MIASRVIPIYIIAFRNEYVDYSVRSTISNIVSRNDTQVFGNLTLESAKKRLERCKEILKDEDLVLKEVIIPKGSFIIIDKKNNGIITDKFLENVLLDYE